MSRNLVVIPVYNEESTIEAVFAELCRHYRGDVLIVDDGSTDDSLNRIHCCNKHRLRVIRHEENQGYGASLIDGFKFAREGKYDLVVTMDCDLQHMPRQVPQFIEQIGKLDVLSGSRYLEASDVDDQAPKDRMRINRLITEEINALTGYSITDAFCGFKAYKVSALAKLDLDVMGYAFPLQFWIQAYARGLTVAEIPVARIYKNLDRTFGPELDDPERRLRYYRSIIEEEKKRWNVK